MILYPAESAEMPVLAWEQTKCVYLESVIENGRFNFGEKWPRAAPGSRAIQ